MLWRGHSNIMPCILKANCALQPQKIAEKCVNLVNNILFQKCVNSQNPEKGIFSLRIYEHCLYMYFFLALREALRVN